MSHYVFEVLRCDQACAVLRDHWCQRDAKVALLLRPESHVCTRVQRKACVLSVRGYCLWIGADHLSSSKLIPSDSPSFTWVSDTASFSPTFQCFTRTDRPHEHSHEITGRISFVAAPERMNVACRFPDNQLNGTSLRRRRCLVVFLVACGGSIKAGNKQSESVCRRYADNESVGQDSMCKVSRVDIQCYERVRNRKSRTFRTCRRFSQECT